MCRQIHVSDITLLLNFNLYNGIHFTCIAAITSHFYCYKHKYNEYNHILQHSCDQEPSQFPFESSPFANASTLAIANQIKRHPFF